MNLTKLLALSVFLTLGGCAANNPPTLSSAQRVEIAQIDEALKLVASHHLAEAQNVIQPVIHAKNFDRLPSAEQYRALLTAARLAFDLKQPKLEYESRVRLVALPEATSEDRELRVGAAARLEDISEVVIGLTELARRNPERLTAAREAFVTLALSEGRKKLPHGSTLPLLQALYAAHWKLKWNQEPGEFWRDLALLLLEQNRLPEAIDVSSHVTDEYSIISMRADRRFDQVAAAIPAQFDVDAAAKRRFDFLESAAQQAPKSIFPKLALVDLLREQQHYAASLAAADSLLAEVRSIGDPQKWYEDYKDNYVWIFDSRSRTLRRLGRWDEGLEELATATGIPEWFGENVSQIINLAGLYSDLGRPKDALDSIARLGTQMSPYGHMQEASVRLRAAVQLGDAQQSEKWSAFISQHRSDAPRTHQAALLLLGRQDAAAEWLIERLEDRDQRAETLLSIQDYVAPRETPIGAESASRRRALIGRPDVQAEIQKVGRIERYDLEAL